METLVSYGPGELVIALLVQLALIRRGIRAVERAILRSTPWVPLAYPLFLPGTVLHESAHAVVAFCLRLGITEVALFRPRRGAHGSVELGYVTVRGGDRVRMTLFAIAPVVLVPPFLLGATLAIALSSIGPTPAGLVAWFVLVGLGSLGAFPSPGDDLPVEGVLALLIGVAVICLCAYLLGSGRGLAEVLAVAVIGLSVPSILFASLFAVRVLSVFVRYAME